MLGSDGKRSQKNNEMVKVAVRCRPMSDIEITNKYLCSVQVEPSRNTVKVFDLRKEQNLANSKIFTFDATFDGSAGQNEVYDRMVRPLVDAVLSGYNGTVFAYGQSGSGKTYTMEGMTSDCTLGILPRTFENIFEHISKSCNIQYLIRASYIEIYQDEIKDLLDRNTGKKYEIRESKNSGIYVKDVSSYVCKSKKEMSLVIEAGRQNRTVASTEINERSSRSHAIVTITVEMKDLTGPLEGRIRVGKLNLVDLAGSERQNKTNAEGNRLKEANKINLSLSALGNVISALSENNNYHIPYRDSKLTRILKDSLGGNAKTVMIANIGPASYNYEETLNTLRYASRAKNIRNEPQVNEDPVDTLIRRYQEEIKQLKSKLEERVAYNNCSSIKKTNNLKYSRDSQLKSKESCVLPAEKETSQDKLHDNMEGEENETIKNLRKQIELMESKLLVGSKDILEYTLEQKKSLEEHNYEINKIKKREKGINKILEKEKEFTNEIKEDFYSLKQEVEVKKQNLTKMCSELQAIYQEIVDVKDEYNADRRELEIAQQEILKEIKLKLLIVENFIPKECRRQLYSKLYYNKDSDRWLMKTNELHEIVPKLKDERHSGRHVALVSSNTQRTRSILDSNVKINKFKRENILELGLTRSPPTTKKQPTKLPTALNKILQTALQFEEDIDIDAKRCSLSARSCLNSSRRSLESVVKNNCHKNSRRTQSAVDLPYYPKARGLVPK